MISPLLHRRHLLLPLLFAASALFTGCGTSPGNRSPTPGSVAVPGAGPRSAAVQKLVDEASALSPLARSELSRRFLPATESLPAVAPRTVFQDPQSREYFSPAKAAALPEARRNKLLQTELDEFRYYSLLRRASGRAAALAGEKYSRDCGSWNTVRGATAGRLSVAARKRRDSSERARGERALASSTSFCTAADLGPAPGTATLPGVGLRLPGLVPQPVNSALAANSNGSSRWRRCSSGLIMGKVPTAHGDDSS